METINGLPARRKRGLYDFAHPVEHRLDKSLKALASTLFTAQNSTRIWDAVPQSLKNASRKKDEHPAAAAGRRDGLDMAAQFAKVSTTNPLVHEFLDKRIVRLTGPIDDAVATSVISMMQLLDDLEPGRDIELRINSPGGSVTAGLAIYDAMKSMNSDVRTVCEGEAMSMAAVLLIAGTPGKRFAMPSATIMVHNVSGGFKGTTEDMKIYVREMERMENVLAEVLSQYSGLGDKDVKDLLNRDHFMTPQEAKALNLIDGVIAHKHRPPFPKPVPVKPAPVAS